MTAAQRLREVMALKGLTRKDVAALLGVSKPTVDSWLRPEDNKAFRAMPQPMVELLEYKTGQK